MKDLELTPNERAFLLDLLEALRAIVTKDEKNTAFPLTRVSCAAARRHAEDILAKL
jgi:hypothetical protein